MSAVLTASDQLASSRERLRQAMRNTSAAPGGSSTQRAGRPAMAWLDGLKAIPGASVVIEAVSSWWAQHPLRIAGLVAVGGATGVLQPLAQRHPLGLVLGALLAGGLFAWSRPWRWILTPALFAGLLPQLFSRALAHVPPGSWMAILTALAQETRRPAPPPREPGPPTEPTQQAPPAPAHMSAP